MNNELRAGVFVLGMHRSGTSFAAGLMPSVGLAPLRGTEREPGESNAKSNREIEEMRLVNVRLLRSAGHDGFAINPPFVPLGSDSVSPNRLEHARTQFRSRLPDRSWYWKDPRLSLTLPIFLGMLEAGERPYAVVPFRHPIEVALSHRKRDELALPVGLALWEAYVQCAMRAVEGLPTFFVDYSKALAEPAALVERLHDQLHRDGVVGASLDVDSALDWAEPTLRHHDASSREYDGVLLPAQRALHEWLLTQPGFDPAFRAVDLPGPSEWALALMESRAESLRVPEGAARRPPNRISRGLRRLKRSIATSR